MKSKVNILAFISLGILFSVGLTAQDEKYGDDPETCRIQLSTYSEYFNQKNYTDAYPAWSWCFHNCPEATRNIYVQGATLMEHFINNETDPEKKEAYIDTLMMVYDNRVKYFGQKGSVWGRKAVSILRYRPERIEEAYNVLEEAYQESKENTEYYVLEFYMSSTVVMYNREEITGDKVIEIYENISSALNHQISNEPNEEKRSKIEESAKKVEEIFAGSGVANCETIIRLYTPKFEENPTDIELARKILALLDAGNSDECKLSDLYMNVATLLYKNERTANSAHSIAQAYLKRKEASESEKYYNEAIELESDPIKKANIYYELALLYYSMTNEYPKARTAARSAIANNPNHGRAYMLIGRIYAAGGRSCGETSLEKKYVYLLVVDYFVKARNVDPDLSSEVNELIGRYTSSFPKNEELFWVNLSPGDVVTIGCWINESTTLRTSD
ncbi:MAG: tetratricopeptide repeat protein [Bacteroidales bacterium]|jgi:tetratricopeptide (TPR) repeat protein|nr:tetratricopeptide repeat protein [Bacteroidales bacterium]